MFPEPVGEQGQNGVDKQRQHHAHENDSLIFHVAVEPCGKSHHKKYRQKAAERAGQRQSEHAGDRQGQPKNDHQGRTERRAGRNPQRIGRGQRIFEHRLHHRAADCQRRAHHKGKQGARQAYVPQNRHRNAVNRFGKRQAEQLVSQYLQDCGRRNADAADADRRDERGDTGSDSDQHLIPVFHSANSAYWSG